MSALIILLTILIFILGLVVLSMGSSYLVTAIVKVADIIGIPTLIISALILSIVSGLPEFTNSFLAALNGIPSLGVGNLIGSSIVSLTVVVGILYLFSKPKKIKDFFNSRLLLLLLVPILMFLIFGLDNLISRFEGAVFLLMYVIFEYILIRKGTDGSSKYISSRRLIFPYLMMPLSIFCVIVGGFLVIDTGETLAVIAGLTSSVIGLTFIAIGTMLPEIMHSISSIIHKRPDVTTGTSTGGIAVYMMLILGLMATIFTLPINYNEFIIPLLFLAGTIIFYSGYTQIMKRTDRLLGFSLVLLFAIHLTLSFLVKV